MADFEQRGELPALVCGASGKEITFAGKFQPESMDVVTKKIDFVQGITIWK